MLGFDSSVLKQETNNTAKMYICVFENVWGEYEAMNRIVAWPVFKFQSLQPPFSRYGKQYGGRFLLLNTEICSWKHFTRGNSNAVTESGINIASLQLDPSSVRGISFSLFNIDPLCVAYKNEEMQSALEPANERSGERFDIVHLQIPPRFNVIIFLHSQDSLESDALETSTLGWPDWERTEWNGTVFSTTRAGIP